MHASATQVWVPNYFTELFLSELIAYQNTMESNRTQYKSSKNRNSLQNVKCKYLEQNYCNILEEIWLLSDDLRRLSIDSPYHHTRAWNSIIPVFFPICSLSMISMGCRFTINLLFLISLNRFSDITKSNL